MWQLSLILRTCAGNHVLRLDFSTASLVWLITGREDGKSARDEGRVQGMIEGVQGIMGKVQRRMGRELGMIGGTVLVNANMKCISSCQEALSFSLSLFPLFYSISSISLPPLYIDSPFSANSPTIINVRKPALSLFPLSQCISANGLLSSLLFPLSHFAVSIHWYDSLSTLTLVTPHEAWEVWGYKA